MSRIQVRDVVMRPLVCVNHGVLVFKPSDFAIINTDGNSDFDVENKLVLRDAQGRKLDLRLNYVYVRSMLYRRPHVLIASTGITPTLVVPLRFRFIARISCSTRPGCLSGYGHRELESGFPRKLLARRARVSSLLEV